MYGAFISRRKLSQNRRSHPREGVEYRTPGGQNPENWVASAKTEGGWYPWNENIYIYFSPIQPPFNVAMFPSFCSPFLPWNRKIRKLRQQVIFSKKKGKFEKLSDLEPQRREQTRSSSSKENHRREKGYFDSAKSKMSPHLRIIIHAYRGREARASRGPRFKPSVDYAGHV